MLQSSVYASPNAQCGTSANPVFFFSRTVEASDAKGEPIHQTLMAKKMQKLDESPDFRPFKFRIQAFTNAFHEEQHRHGFSEEMLPLRKVKNYLWTQRFDFLLILHLVYNINNYNNYSFL